MYKIAPSYFYHPMDPGDWHAPDIWLHGVGWIEDALEYAGGTHDIEDVARGVMGGDYTYIPGAESAAVVELRDSPTGLRTAHIWLAGGDIDDLVDRVLPAIEEWAREYRADRVTIAGRKGWQRVLKDRDYRPAWVTLSKEIT